MKPNNIVFDSFALIALLQDEPGAPIVEQIINQSSSQNLYIHRVNWGEIYYTNYKQFGPKPAQKAIDKIARLPIQVIDKCDQEFVLKAASIKGQHAVSYADAFAIQLTLDLKANLVTGDPEIKKATTQIKNLSLTWLGN